MAEGNTHTNAKPEGRPYRVHLYALVRVPVEIPSALSHIDAISLAEKNTDLHTQFVSGEYAEDVCYAMVEEATPLDDHDTTVYVPDSAGGWEKDKQGPPMLTEKGIGSVAQETLKDGSAQVSIETQSNDPAAQKLVVLGANYTADDEDCPLYCAFRIDTAFLQRLTALHQLCVEHKLSEVTETAYPEEWGPVGIEDQVALQDGELKVDFSGRVWFSDRPKHGDGRYESTPVDINSLREILISDAPLHYASQSVRDFYEEEHVLGDDVDRPRPS